MKKLTTFFLISLLCGFVLNINAQANKIDTSFYSEALSEQKMVDIYFPPDYDENSNLYYPVIYYLHPWGGDQNTMIEMVSLLESLIINGLIDPVIMVGADNSPEPFHGSMYVNSTIWGDYESYMINDLINWIETSFRAMPFRDYRGLMGHSMGGYGSFRYGILYKDKFRVLAAHAGLLTFDIDIWLEPSRQKVILENPSGPPYSYSYSYGNFTGGTFLLSGAFSPNLNSPQDYIYPQIVDFLFDENANFIDSVVMKYQQNDILLNYIHQLNQDDSLGILFGCGTNDNLLLNSPNLAMKDTLDVLGIPYEYYSHGGGHVMPNGFKNRALRFIDSLLMPPDIYIGIQEPILQEPSVSLLSYPNPFTTSTTISYELKQPESVYLSIYNHLGQIIYQTQENQTQGTQQLIWNAEKYGDGMYYYRLLVGDEATNGKMMKVK